MNRYATLSILLLASCSLSAQIQIGENEMPHAGDALMRTRANPNPTLDFTTTGPDHTWDFTGLSVAAEDVAAYQTVASTNIVYAVVFADIFFNSNRANHAREGVDIPFNQLLPITNPYTFLYHTPSVYKKVGYGVELSGIPVPIIFNAHDVIYNLPLNYGDADASTSSYELSIPTLAYYGYQQERSNDVDGWGTITTPAGSFEVLRVKTTLAGRDTINLDTLGLGFAIDRPLVHEYKWLAQDLRVPVLQINTTEIFGFELITEVFFYDEPRTITVVPPLPQTLCPGSTFELAYETTGAFNAGGFLVPANIFTAQLSDAGGGFAAPTAIGQVTATGSGTIPVTIPPGTPLGSGYRIRVISSSPAFVGDDNGFDITISDQLPIAAISAAGPTEFCAGGSVLLQAEPAAGDYQWALDGQPIAGAQGDSYEATEPGDYTLTIVNACGSDLSEAITVTVGQAPEHTFDQTSYLSCDGAPVSIAAQDVSGQSPLTYQWFFSGTPVDGEIASTILAAEAGIYFLEITNTSTGCVFTTPEVAVVVDQVPAPVVTALGEIQFCEGGSVILEVDAVPGLSYQWLVDGGPVDGGTGDQLEVTTSGAYAVVATATSGCASEPSTVLDVEVDPLPEVPVISQVDDQLTSSGSGEFQWYLEGVAIDGATADTYLPMISGNYSVTVNDTNGCSSTSEVFVFISTGIMTSTGSSPTIFPNPSEGSFFVVTDGSWTPGAGYSVFDAMGQPIATGGLVRDRTPIDLQGRSGGLYVVRITNGDVVTDVKVILR